MRGQYLDEEFKRLRQIARMQGTEINNVAFNIYDLFLAFQLKSEILTGERWEDISPAELAKYLKLSSDSWLDIFVNHNVNFDPTREIIRDCRDDILSWALALAQLYINCYEELYSSESSSDDEDVQQFQQERKSTTDTLDDDCPFDI